MKGHKSMTVRVDETDGKIYIYEVFPEAILCLYDISGNIIEIKQTKTPEVSFDIPSRGKYVLVVTHALHMPIVKKLVIE